MNRQKDQKLQLWEEEVERFVLFGEVLDRRTRAYFVEYLRSKLLGESPEPVSAPYFHYFSAALDDLFDDPDLHQLVRQNERLGLQVLADSLRWFRKTYRELAKKHPYSDEQTELESWAVRHLRQFTRSWPFMIQKLAHYYRREDLDPSYHESQFKRWIGSRKYENLSAEDCQQIERVFKDLLAQWDARLQAKILDFQMRHLREKKQQYREKLQSKVKQFQKLSQYVKPFSDELSRYWDMSQALWQDSSLDLVEQYQSLLEDESELKKLADLLGRMREASLESEEEHYEKVLVSREQIRDPLLRSEIVGVRQSRDISQLLPSEVALFGDDTEWEFIKRFAEEQLQTHHYEDQRWVESREVQRESFQKIKKKQKGPFILCIDTSGSMEGEPERIAKILSFAILKMAAREERPAYLINFSRGIQSLDLYRLSESLDELAAFLQKSFRGGTDISLALGEALRQLETNAYRDADVLVVSDFIMYKLSDDLCRQIQKQQNQQGTHFHSLIITDQANEEVIEVFDNSWRYHPDERRLMRELHRNIKTIV